VRVGFPAIARHDSTYAALTLANAVLGNFGRIWRALREQKGYAYTAGSVLDARRDAGALRAFAAVQTGVTAQALSDLLAVLRDATGTQPITDEELVAARVRLFRNEPFAFETNAQVASRLEGLALRGLDAGGDDTFLRQLGLLTRSDVLSAVARFSVRPTIVVVGDRSRIEGPLRALGLPVRIVTPGSKK
jgi:zinc protease